MSGSGTRLSAMESKATNRPSAEIAPMKLSRLPWAPFPATLTRSVVPVRRSRTTGLRLIAGGALIDPADVAAELDGLDPARHGLLAGPALKASQLLLAEQDHQIVVLE